MHLQFVSMIFFPPRKFGPMLARVFVCGLTVCEVTRTCILRRSNHLFGCVGGRQGGGHWKQGESANDLDT